MNMQFDKTLGKHITSLSYLLSKQLNKSLEEHYTEITSDQFRLMTNLWRRDGISQQKLAIYIGRDRANIARMVSILEKNGFVTRISDEKDKRINLIFLTKKGKELEHSAWKSVQDSLSKMTINFTEDEITQFEQLLIKAANNLKPIVSAKIKRELSQ